MKICLVCSHGGHLTELLYLIEAFEGNEIFFVTYDNPRTRNLKYRKYLLPHFGERPSKFLKNLPKIISIMLKEKPDVIVSNGAEIAIPFFYLGKLFRKKTIFIECYTRINDPTITGTMVYPISDLFLVLWPDLLKKFRKKAQYWGGIFEVRDKISTELTNEKENMLFVIVGMHTAGFERLIKKMDEIAEKIDDQVLMQIGHTQYIPTHAEYFKFKEKDEEIKELIKNAKIVICQGAMTVIDSLMSGTRVISVPRLKKFGEHLNDHQLIFSKKLEEMGLIRVVEDVDELENIIKTEDQLDAKALIKNKNLIVKLRKFLKNLKQD